MASTSSSTRASALVFLGAVVGVATATPTFKSYCRSYGLSFTSEEASLREVIFNGHLQRINKHNSDPTQTYTLGINKFSHLTADEWRATVGLVKKPAKKQVQNLRTSTTASTPSVDAQLSEILEIIGGEIPTTVNWTAAGGVTPVKDQGQCGSCWAFATTVATEGAHFIKNKTLLSLSEQQIVSCDDKDGNQGCNGGEQITAMQWLAKQEGQCTEAGYPYKSGNGNTLKCEKTCTPTVKIASGVELAAGNETLLMAAIAMVPLSLSVDASNDAIWQSYSGGVVTEACKCNNDNCLDHGVGGVGFGTDASGGDYWLVKNSWGSDWGEGGYIRLARGAAYNPHGQCGVQIDNAYVVSGN